MKKSVASLLNKSGWCCFALAAGLLLGPAGPLSAALPQLLSARSPSVAPLPGGNGDSVTPRLSDNGRYVVFSSAATDLVPNTNGQFFLNVYLRDRVLNTTLLISASTNGRGGNGDSLAGQVSANGRYVVFQSDASNLLPGDTNGVTDIFLRDTFTGAIRLISVATNGGFGSGASTEPVMTPDGTCVAFISAATNLVAKDTNGCPDVFVRDLITQTTWPISVGAAGTNSTMDTPVITSDGRFVAFFSTTTNLAPGVPPTTLGEIYVRDRLAGTTTWASTNAAIIVSNLLYKFLSIPMSSVHPALSDDGRYVAFKTTTNGITSLDSLVAAPGEIFFQYDSLNRTTTIVDTNGYPHWVAYDDIYGPEMTPDGRFIAYVDRIMTGGKTNSNIRLWDRLAGTNVLVNLDTNGLWASNNITHTPAVSDDGRYVTFLSEATNLVSNTVSNGLHIYRRDLQTATTVLLDADTNGVGSLDELGVIPVLSADGSCAAYVALDGGLIAGDNNNVQDVFAWDAALATNVLISVHNPSVVVQSGNGLSTPGPISVSGNGARVAFASYATDLALNDTNFAADVFVRDLTANSNILVSVGLNGNPGIGGPSSCPVISADGRYIIFLSGATNLVTGGTIYSTYYANRVFRRNLQTGTTELVNINTNGVNDKYDAYSPVASQDGRYIAFLCRTNNGSSTVLGALTNIFWLDMSSGLTLAVPGYVYASLPISMSADGQRLAYLGSISTSLPQLFVWDANLQANIYTNAISGLTSAAISPSGNRLLYLTASQLYVRDLPGTSNLLVCPSTVPIKGSSQWSGDGRYVAFVTATNLVPGDSNGTNDVYLLDMQTSLLTLVSLNQGATASAAGVSDSPVVSPDGRFVVFRSFATNIVAGITNPPSLIVFDRQSGLNSLLVSGTTGSGWTTWLSRPTLSTNELQLAFQSWDSGLAGGDLNRAGDVFGVNNWPAVDSDGDGIPDWWMMQYFGHATGQAGDFSRAQDDADLDGMNNLREFRSGTVPTNANSRLTLNITPDGSGTNAVLDWAVAAGRNYNYQVLSATNLSDSVWQPVPGPVSAIGSQRYLNVMSTNTQTFFRVQCGN
jgi:Tol biopolymer transport system component